MRVVVVLVVVVVGGWWLSAYFLGHVPTLVSDTPIYETARRDRCKLVTSNAGELHLRLFVLTRHFEIQNMDTVAPQK